MEISRKAVLTAVIGVALGLTLTLILPKEKKWNRNAAIRIGAGDDISGILMDETVRELTDVYHFEDDLESSSFKDCWSNLAQWALSSDEINVAFYCEHIALQSVKENDRIMIYGPAVMNAETVISKADIKDAKVVGVGSNRINEIDEVKRTYPHIEDVRQISQRALLYSLEDGDIDAAVLDITKTAKVPGYSHWPVGDRDYVSYVLVVDKEFAKTDAFADFIVSCNRAADRLNDRTHLAELLGVDEDWLDGQNIRFLKLKEPG